MTTETRTELEKLQDEVKGLRTALMYKREELDEAKEKIQSLKKQLDELRGMHRQLVDLNVKRQGFLHRYRSVVVSWAHGLMVPATELQKLLDETAEPSHFGDVG